MLQPTKRKRKHPQLVKARLLPLLVSEDTICVRAHRLLACSRAHVHVLLLACVADAEDETTIEEL